MVAHLYLNDFFRTYSLPIDVTLNLKDEYFVFSINHFGQNFIFFIGCYFSKVLDGIKENAPKHQKR